MEAYEQLMDLCRQRRSVRSFSPRPVSREDIDRILALASTSPYASGDRKWRMVTVEDSKLIKEMAAVVRQAAKKLTIRVRDDFHEGFAAYSRHFAAFESASCLLIPCFRVAHPVSHMMGQEISSFSGWERDNYVKSISCVSMLVLLAAQSLGLGACLMTGPLLAQEELAGLISITPGWEMAGIIPIGYEVESKKGA